MIKDKMFTAIGARREREVEELDSKMKRMSGAMKLTDALPEDLPDPKDIYVGSWFWPIELTWPADMDLMDDVKMKFVNAGFSLEEPQVSEGLIQVKARLIGAAEFYMYVTLDFNTEDEAATCHVTKVGTKRREVVDSVYEIECPEAHG